MSETWCKLDDLLSDFRTFGIDCKRLKWIIQKRIFVGLGVGIIEGVGWTWVVLTW